MTSQTGTMRLNRAIASSGLCSRRKADELVLGGRVAVNGQIQTSPAVQVCSRDRIEVDRKALDSPAPHVYIKLNKPVQVVCTASDPQHRTTVIDLLPAHLRKLRVFPVGRLDYFSEGLLILTNDGDLAQKLAHPSHQHRKVYEVTVREAVTPAQLAEMKQGMTLLDGTRLAPVEAAISKERDGNTRLALTLRQGVNRQIRRMCEKLGLTILRLKRISQGSIKLGALRPGAWSELTQAEIRTLENL